MITITIGNSKGGVGKTSTVQNLVAGLSLIGKKVLVIDADPQANLSNVLGVPNTTHSIYNLLKKECSLDDVITSINDNVDLIASDMMASNLETDLINQLGKEYILKELLETVHNDYDFCIIDTPPAIGILTINAFTASNYVVIPSVPSLFSITGITQYYNTIKDVKKYYNPSLDIAGVLITQSMNRTNLAKDMQELTNALGENLNINVFNSVISSSVAVPESQAQRLDIFEYDKKNTVALNYITFLKELLNIVEVK